MSFILNHKEECLKHIGREIIVDGELCIITDFLICPSANYIAICVNWLKWPYFKIDLEDFDQTKIYTFDELIQKCRWISCAEGKITANLTLNKIKWKTLKNN